MAGTPGAASPHEVFFYYIRNELHAVRSGRWKLHVPHPYPTIGCFRHQLLLPRPYLVLTKPLRLDIQCQRAASVKIGWKYLDD